MLSSRSRSPSDIALIATFRVVLKFGDVTRCRASLLSLHAFFSVRWFGVETYSFIKLFGSCVLPNFSR